MNGKSPQRRPRAGDLNIAQLETFRLVMRHGGYHAAAKESHLSPPAVWQHIQALEKAYRTELFVRVGRQIKPTDAAIKLHEQLDDILVRLESTFDSMRSPSADQSIRLVTGVRMMLEDLSQPLAGFRKRHANPLVVCQGNERRAEEMLLADEADLALALQPGLKQGTPQIHYEPAYAVDFLAVSTRNHDYARCRSASLHELAKHPLVVTITGTHARDALDQAFHREGLTPNIAIETDNGAFTVACVMAGMGVGVLAGREQGTLSRKLHRRSLRKPLGRRRIDLMWRRGRLLSEPVLDLIEEIKRIGD
ncbi:MAG: LysR family transcriptional regulator [Planctomycetota bacterium]